MLTAQSPETRLLRVAASASIVIFIPAAITFAGLKFSAGIVVLHFVPTYFAAIALGFAMMAAVLLGFALSAVRARSASSAALGETLQAAWAEAARGRRVFESALDRQPEIERTGRTLDIGIGAAQLAFGADAEAGTLAARGKSKSERSGE